MPGAEPKPSVLEATLDGRLRAGGSGHSGFVGYQHQSLFVAQHLSQSPRSRVSWRLSRREQARRDKKSLHGFESPGQSLLHELWAPGNPRGDNWKPLHVINAALNLVSSKNLAWQERMAGPFTFSPLHCAAAVRRSLREAHIGRPRLGRIKISRMGAPKGLTLGTAMAISGAAVSPNMGYNSSPGVAFLMTLCNVRLGWWLPNPRTENCYYWLTGPIVALRPYFMEMFGLTSETERWVYLSDGGHFENLGVYEMVRRRCRVIVVSDASCDPGYKFDDLGNALRKIWIDLGVRIEMNGLDRIKKRFKGRPSARRSLIGQSAASDITPPTTGARTVCSSI